MLVEQIIKWDYSRKIFNGASKELGIRNARNRLSLQFIWSLFTLNTVAMGFMTDSFIGSFTAAIIGFRLGVMDGFPPGILLSLFSFARK